MTIIEAEKKADQKYVLTNLPVPKATTGTRVIEELSAPGVGAEGLEARTRCP